MLTLLLAVLTAQVDGQTTTPVAPAPPPAMSPVDAGVPGLDPEPLVHLGAGAEGELGVLSSGWAENGADIIFGFRPMVSMSVTEVFSIQLGPLLRLRVIDTPPLDRAQDLGGVLRGADWDRTSDFGEILQALRIGTEQSVFHLKAGPVHKKSLGLGHLLFRYSNRLNADARPASAMAVLQAGFIRAEVFASDVLAPRLFAGEVAWDLGRTFSSNAPVFDRYVLSLSLAHDFNRLAPAAREPGLVDELAVPEATLLHVDAKAVLLRTNTLTLLIEGGVGARGQTRDLGFLAGAAMDVRVPDVELSLRAEGRKQAGGFRHGFFGAQYELARASGVGLGLQSQLDERLPDAFSIFGELRFRLLQTVTLDGAVEVFTFGRTDFDATVSVELLESKLVAEARLGVMGLGQAPRWLATGGLRWRLFRSFYVLGSGGTAFFPSTGGGLVRGFQASAGVGVDIER